MVIALWVELAVVIVNQADENPVSPSRYFTDCLGVNVFTLNCCSCSVIWYAIRALLSASGPFKLICFMLWPLVLWYGLVQCKSSKLSAVASFEISPLSWRDCTHRKTDSWCRLSLPIQSLSTLKSLLLRHGIRSIDTQNLPSMPRLLPEYRWQTSRHPIIHPHPQSNPSYWTFIWQWSASEYCPGEEWNRGGPEWWSWALKVQERQQSWRTWSIWL